VPSRTTPLCTTHAPKPALTSLPASARRKPRPNGRGNEPVARGQARSPARTTPRRRPDEPELRHHQSKMGGTVRRGSPETIPASRTRPPVRGLTPLITSAASPRRGGRRCERRSAAAGHRPARSADGGVHRRGLRGQAFPHLGSGGREPDRPGTSGPPSSLFSARLWAQVYVVPSSSFVADCCAGHGFRSSFRVLAAVDLSLTSSVPRTTRTALWGKGYSSPWPIMAIDARLHVLQ